MAPAHASMATTKDWMTRTHERMLLKSDEQQVMGIRFEALILTSREAPEW